MNDEVKKQLSTVQRYAALVAVAGAVLCAFGYWWSPARFFEAYLFAFVVVSGVGLGCMALVMLGYLVGGKWSLATRRVLEAAAWPLVIAPLIALPLVAGIDELYLWADADVVRHDATLADKSAYLNVEFFQGRAVGYLLIWAVFACLLAWRSRAAERSNDHSRSEHARLRKLSALGIVIYVLTATFAAIDWMMSLEPHWFSAIYGVIVIAGQGAAGFAVAIIVLFWLRHDTRVASLATRDVFQDLGNLLLAAVTFWIYVTFSQFLIIWSGNLAEEVPWYLARAQGGWQWMAVALVLLHFTVPFMALLSRDVKREPRYLAGVAMLVAVMHVVDVFWLVMPALRESLAVHWLDVVALGTLGALWKAVSTRRLASAAPVVSQQYKEGLEHGNIGIAEQPS